MKTAHGKLIVSSAPWSSRRAACRHRVAPSPNDRKMVIGVTKLDCFLIAGCLFRNGEAQLGRITQARTGMVSSPGSSVVGHADIVDECRTEDVSPSTVEVL